MEGGGQQPYLDLALVRYGHHWVCKERDVVDKRYRLSIIVQTEGTHEDIVQKEKMRERQRWKQAFFSKCKNKRKKQGGQTWRIQLALCHFQKPWYWLLFEYLHYHFEWNFNRIFYLENNFSRGQWRIRSTGVTLCYNFENVALSASELDKLVNSD